MRPSYWRTHYTFLAICPSVGLCPVGICNSRTERHRKFKFGENVSRGATNYDDAIFKATFKSLCHIKRLVALVTPPQRGRLLQILKNVNVKI